MKKIFFLSTLFLSFAFASAQSQIETVLAGIAKNNKTILANNQYWESQKLLFKTGLAPNNPSVEYDYMIGSPSGAGNQTDFTITQSFDFPTAYVKRKQLSEQQIAQAEFQIQSKRQDILLEAKLICIELVYRNKLSVQLSKRKASTEKLVFDFQKRMEKGEGNILDVNKAQLQLLEIQKQSLENSSVITQLNTKLTELNGGTIIFFSDTIYQTLSVIPSFDQLEKEYEAADPLRKALEQEKNITQKELELSKTMQLPKFEGGYHYQGILGQNFSGFHSGISIPLWENKNAVKQKKAELLFSDLNLQDHLNEHYFEVKRLYEKFQSLQVIFQQYQSVLNSYNNAALLDKAFSSGQISSIEYFMELSYYQNSYTNYLQSEKEYYEVIAELFKYKM